MVSSLLLLKNETLLRRQKHLVLERSEFTDVFRSSDTLLTSLAFTISQKLKSLFLVCATQIQSGETRNSVSLSLEADIFNPRPWRLQFDLKNPTRQTNTTTQFFQFINDYIAPHDKQYLFLVYYIIFVSPLLLSEISFLFLVKI